VGQGPSAVADALSGHPSLARAAGARQGRDAGFDLNRAFLSGVLAEDPQRESDRDGDPVLLLMVAFPAPDTRDTRLGAETALQEVEVAEPVAERHHGELRAGAAIFVTGQLSGGGGVIATAIHLGPPPDHAAGSDNQLDPNE
jgi:hypothetical protein